MSNAPVPHGNSHTSRSLTRGSDSESLRTEPSGRVSLAQNPDEIMMAMNALSGIEHQNRQLLDLLNCTWSDQIRPMFQNL